MVKMQYVLSSKTNILTTSAAAYGEGTYGTESYGAEGTSGGLADTGYDVIIPIALGLALIIAGAILLAKRLIRRKKASQSQK